MSKNIDCKYERMVSKAKNPLKRQYLERLREQWNYLDNASDRDLTISNANTRGVCSDDYLYNKIDANDPYKKKMENRKMKQKTYESLVKEIKRSLLPSQLRGLSVLSKSSVKKLKDVIETYSFSLDELKTAIKIKEGSRTNWAIIEKLLDYGYNLKNVDNFLYARKEVENRLDSIMPVHLMLEFINTFGLEDYIKGRLAVNPEDLSNEIIRTCESFEGSSYWERKLSAKRFEDLDPLKTHAESRKLDEKVEVKPGVMTTINNELAKTLKHQGNLIFLSDRMKMILNIAKQRETRGLSDDLESVIRQIAGDDGDFFLESGCREIDHIDYLEYISDKDTN